MNRSMKSRILSWFLILAMVFSMLPVSALAAEGTAAYTKITSAEDLTSGQYVMVAESGYAPTVLDGSWVLAAAVTTDGDILTDPAANLVWTLTVDGTNVKLTDSNGATIAPKGGNNNGIKSGDYSWTVTCTDGTFQFAGQGEDTVVLASNKGSENKFRGYKTSTVSGNTAGYPCNFTLYKLAEDETPVEPSVPETSAPTEAPTEPETFSYQLTNTLAAGDVVVLYNTGNTVALSSTASGYKLSGVTVTPAEDVISTADETLAWTVGISDDGTYTFTQGEMVLGMVQSGSYINLSTNAADGYTAWTLENSATEKVFYLKNTNMPASESYGPYYLEYYSGFTAYASNSPADAAFGISFYKLVEEPEEPTTPSEPETPTEPETPVVSYAEKMADLPANGDTIIIYNSGNALGSAASGKKLAGVAAEVADNKLPIADEMAQLLVTIDEDGNYIFTLDGQYLTSAETGNGLSFAAELTDCGKWTMTAATDGSWYIKNVGANYNGNYNQAMEYYSGFTTYGIKETEIYQMQLFLVAGAPVYAVPNGDYVIWAPAYNISLSSNYSGYYNSGVAVTETDGKLTGYTNAEIWTVTNNDDGTISISFGGQNLAMADSYSSLTLGEAHDKWVLEDAGNGLFYVKNTVRGAYIEWYADKNNWSGYGTIGSGKEGMFALKFTPAEASDETESTLPEAGDQVVIYNLNAEGVLGAQNDTESIENVLTEIVDGKAVPANGGVVFTVEKNDTYYRFYNEAYGYLCSYGTGNNAIYRLEASEDTDWTVTSGKSGGYFLESRTAKYNGQYSQYLEYYADSYKTYSMYNVTDYDIYEFFFYEVAESVNVTEGIVNNPDVRFLSNPVAYLGQDFTASFEIDAVFGVQTLVVTATAGDVTYTLEPTLELGAYSITVTAEQIKALNDASIATGMPAGSFTILISGADTKGVEFGNGGTIDIVDKPVIGEVSPAANTETGDDKKPVISAEIINAGEDAEITMSINDEPVDAVFADGILSYTPAEDMTNGRTTVKVTVTRADGKTAEKIWTFIVGEAQYQLYFGQLHSHTTYSDGSGSLESALEYIASLPESANVDFVAFTDHSNYFDKSGEANPEGALYDMTQATAYSQETWAAYVNAIRDFNNRQGSVIAIPGFEMTWSGGPGHINTFNTPGIVSRNNTTLNNKSSDAGMKAYYALLSQPEGIDSISQFNHPGSTFGTFSDFAYWDAVIDTRIQLVEVGNGEGQIGAGGYYPSYEYYTMALDKGWHVAPTNNQDNHKGKWGNANEARDVVITDDFSEEGIYAAIRAMRMYATEDKNLEITYTLNDQLLGSCIEEVPEKLTLNVTVYDPDDSDSISKVEVIVNSGKVAYTWSNPADLAGGALTVELNPDYSYYYIRVTEGDGDLAVTAPVWVGESLKMGISSVVSSTSTPITDEELTVTTTLFNSESTQATIKSMTYTVDGKVVGVVENPGIIPAAGTASLDFQYTPDTAKVQKLAVTAVLDLEGKEYTFTMDLTLDVQDASKLVYIGIDASHYNEYVNGNYKDSMGNFSLLAANYNIRTVMLYTSEDLIAACSNPKYKALILTAPSRRSADAQAADPLKVYTETELEAIQAFNAQGGIVILAGWSDHYENYPSVESIANMAAEEHMAATQNAVLEALGSSLRIADDATYDDSYNGGQAYRLYFNTYNFDNALVTGVEVDPEHPHDRMYTEVFSHYGGASVYTADGTLPATVSPVVFGHSTTYSKDVDGDGLGGESVPKYAYAEGDNRLMIMASEQLEGRGLIIVSGAAFMSDFEVQAEIEDSGAEKNYANYKICENLCELINPVQATPIAEVRAQTEAGYKYTIEGIVTSNASGYDKDTAFFDCIYVQDATGGICCFPVAGNYKIGDKVRITGTTEFYQGESELQVTSIEVIGEGTVEPTAITAAQLNDRSVEGMLVTISGTVESFELANGLVQTIMVKDAEGNLARIFIDGYITTDADVQNLAVGAKITATGLASYDDTFNAPEGPFQRIRIRNRADVICEVHVHEHLVTESVDATCTEGGYITFTCACGDTYTETIAAFGHNVILMESSPATCDLNGYEYYACEHCGGEEYTVILEATGHDYQDGSCVNCGAEDPDYVKPGKPSWGDWFKEWFGSWWGDDEEECDHTYTSVVTDPTCTDKGYTTHTCTKCGDSYKDNYVDAIGHDYEDGSCIHCGEAENKKPWWADWFKWFRPVF